MRVDDFICFSVFDYTVLVNARTVRKCIGTYNGFVGLYNHAHGVRYHLTCFRKHLGLNVSVKPKIRVLAHDHHYLFQRGITCTFTNTINGTFNLPCTVNHTSNGVCCGKTKVVVAVTRNSRFVNGRHMFHQIFYFGTVFFR